MRNIRALVILVGCLISLQTYSSNAVEVRGVSDEDLKQMAKFEKEHADKAKDSATKARKVAEQKKQMKEQKNER